MTLYEFLTYVELAALIVYVYITAIKKQLDKKALKLNIAVSGIIIFVNICQIIILAKSNLSIITVTLSILTIMVFTFNAKLCIDKLK